MSDWISVEDELPECGSYLVYVASERRPKGVISRKKYMKIGWTMKRDEVGMGLSVTHWMPLPEPPK